MSERSLHGAIGHSLRTGEPMYLGHHKVYVIGGNVVLRMVEIMYAKDFELVSIPSYWVQEHYLSDELLIEDEPVKHNRVTQFVRDGDEAVTAIQNVLHGSPEWFKNETVYEHTMKQFGGMIPNGE